MVRFAINSNNLKAALDALHKVIPPRSVLPIIENVLWQIDRGVLKLTGTNLTYAIRTTIGNRTIGDWEPVSYAFHPKIISEILTALPDQMLLISIDPDKVRMTIAIEDVDTKGYAIQGEASDTFPAMNFDTDVEPTLRLSDSIAKSIVKRVCFAASTEEEKPSLRNIVILERKGMPTIYVATDATRLSEWSDTSCTSEETRTLTIPAAALALLPIRDADVVKITLTDTTGYAVCGNSEITFRLISEPFPAYQNVIPQSHEMSATFDRSELISAIKRGSLLASQVAQATIFEFKSDGQVRITSGMLGLSNVNGEAETFTKCEYKGDSIRIGFDHSLLLPCLSAISSKQVVIEMSSPNRAAIIRPHPEPDHEHHLILVMPRMIAL